MENPIISKFNLYDHIGYLLVGSVGLMIIFFDFNLLNVNYPIPSLDLENSLVWIIAAYLFGHILQAVANMFIKENKTDFSESEKEILEKANKYFEVNKQSAGETYSLCYMLSSAKDITGQVQSFNAYYSLYRGWMIIFILESIFLVFINIMKWFSFGYLVLLFLTLFISWLFYKRSKRFYAYSRGKTLQTFIILSKNA